MNKVILSILTMLTAVIVLAGCSLFAKANGVILYGEEEEILNAVEKEKDKFVEEEQHKIKITTNNNQQIMILTVETAQSLIEKKLIKEITNQEKGKTKAVSSLSKVANGEGLLFTKDKSHEVEIENINVEYEGNLIIGDGRAYADVFLIVNDQDWVSLKGTEKMLAILKYDRDPSVNGISYEVERAQLVRLED